MWFLIAFVLAALFGMGEPLMWFAIAFVLVALFGMVLVGIACALINDMQDENIARDLDS